MTTIIISIVTYKLCLQERIKSCQGLSGSQYPAYLFRTVFRMWRKTSHWRMLTIMVKGTVNAGGTGGGQHSSSPAVFFLALCATYRQSDIKYTSSWSLLLFIVFHLHKCLDNGCCLWFVHCRSMLQPSKFGLEPCLSPPPNLLVYNQRPEGKKHFSYTSSASTLEISASFFPAPLNEYTP